VKISKLCWKQHRS